MLNFYKLIHYQRTSPLWENEAPNPSPHATDHFEPIKIKKWPQIRRLTLHRITLITYLRLHAVFVKQVRWWNRFHRIFHSFWCFKTGGKKLAMVGKKLFILNILNLLFQNESKPKRQHCIAFKSAFFKIHPNSCKANVRTCMQVLQLS